MIYIREHINVVILLIVEEVSPITLFEDCLNEHWGLFWSVYHRIVSATIMNVTRKQSEFKFHISHFYALPSSSEKKN